jgi:hypothetical protein
MNPDSNSSTTTDMPDAIGNSWTDPDITTDCASIYVSTLNALEAAGIAVIFSCGNSGPGTSTITKPKNINTNLVNTFTVGNIDGNSAFPYPIASSSSRGPSLCGGAGSLLIKPEVVAPGTNVRSSVPGGSYGLLSGTSMACPHVVGAVALLKEVAPNLTGKQILEVIFNTAVQLPVGGTENNNFGKGVIDVWAAYQSLGPMITHTPVSNTENLNGPYPVNCSVSSLLSGISTVKLLWSRNNVNITDSSVMIKGPGNNWSSLIPGNGIIATYRYYIKATDSTGRVGTHPVGAPAMLNLFTASSDTIKPVITHNPLGDCAKVNWPATINTLVTDNIGIDSVWVRWYKNTTSTGIKHVKLPLISGSNFAAAFNSTQGDVDYNDSIFYRVFAQDNGSNHKKDSTALYLFKIIAQATGCIGTGTTSTQWPFYTLYDDSRTDMLYLASEISTGGGAAGSIIQIGFNVVSADPMTMNGFKIYLQRTNDSTISTFTSTGWIICYDEAYTVQGTGWQFITLQKPFEYDGTSNLLIEICFNNNTYTSSSSVNSTAATGRVVHNHQDLTTTDGCTAITTPGTSYTALPNICMIMNTAVNANTPVTVIPQVYSLSQNFPNPFNPVTQISYCISKAGLVTLKVFDVLGREVSTLVNEEKQPGTYIVDFNGESFASGVYFYRIESAQFTEVKRMVLLK